MNTWSCARCGKAAFADQNFCRSCGMPREGRRPAPITSQVPIIRTGLKPDAVHADADSGIDDPRTSAPQATVNGAGPEQTVRPPRKRPISLALLAAIAVIFLVVGGVAAIVFGNVRDDSEDEQSPTTAVPTVTATLRTSVTPTTSAQPTTTRPAQTTTATTEPSTTDTAVPTSAATTSAVSSPVTAAG